MPASRSRPQFRRIDRTGRQALQERQPIISIDCKKKELVGDFKNAGREWRPKGEPELVRVHDFKDKQLGKAIPYGVYDIAANQGWVNVGIDHDTAQFAVNSIRGWWQHLGQTSYPDARRLLITADCGGCNGNRLRLWKIELQASPTRPASRSRSATCRPGPANGTRSSTACSPHHENWRGKPLVCIEIDDQPDRPDQDQHRPCGLRPPGRRRVPSQDQVSDAELDTVNLHREAFHPEWNYTIKPRT